MRGNAVSRHGLPAAPARSALLRWIDLLSDFLCDVRSSVQLSHSPQRISAASSRPQVCHLARHDPRASGIVSSSTGAWGPVARG
jgi:hypothetical protein